MQRRYLAIALLCFWPLPVRAQQVLILSPDEVITVHKDGTTTATPRVRQLLRARVTAATTTDQLPTDNTVLLQQILVALQQVLATEQSTNTQVIQINQSFSQTLVSVGKFLGTYIVPPVLSWLVAKKVI